MTQRRRPMVTRQPTNINGLGGGRQNKTKAAGVSPAKARADALMRSRPRDQQIQHQQDRMDSGYDLDPGLPQPAPFNPNPTPSYRPEWTDPLAIPPAAPPPAASRPSTAPPAATMEPPPFPRPMDPLEAPPLRGHMELPGGGRSSNPAPGPMGSAGGMDFSGVADLPVTSDTLDQVLKGLREGGATQQERQQVEDWAIKAWDSGQLDTDQQTKLMRILLKLDYFSRPPEDATYPDIPVTQWPDIAQRSGAPSRPAFELPGDNTHFTSLDGGQPGGVGESQSTGRPQPRAETQVIDRSLQSPANENSVRLINKHLSGGTATPQEKQRIEQWALDSWDAGPEGSDRTAILSLLLKLDYFNRDRYSFGRNSGPPPAPLLGSSETQPSPAARRNSALDNSFGDGLGEPPAKWDQYGEQGGPRMPGQGPLRAETAPSMVVPFDEPAAPRASTPKTIPVTRRNTDPQTPENQAEVDRLTTGAVAAGRADAMRANPFAAARDRQFDFGERMRSETSDLRRSWRDRGGPGYRGKSTVNEMPARPQLIPGQRAANNPQTFDPVDPDREVIGYSDTGIGGGLVSPIYRETDEERMRREEGQVKLDENAGLRRSVRAKIEQYGDQAQLSPREKEVARQIEGIDAAKEKRSDFLSRSEESAKQDSADIGAPSGMTARELEIWKRRQAVNARESGKADDRQDRIREREQNRIPRPMTADDMMMMGGTRGGIIGRGQNLDYDIKRRAIELEREGMSRREARDQAEDELRDAQIDGLRADTDATRQGMNDYRTKRSEILREIESTDGSTPAGADRLEDLYDELDSLPRTPRGGASRPNTAAPEGRTETQPGNPPAPATPASRGIPNRPTEKTAQKMKSLGVRDSSFASRFGLEVGSDGRIDTSNIDVMSILGSLRTYYKDNESAIAPTDKELDLLIPYLRSKGLESGFFTNNNTYRRNLSLHRSASATSRDGTPVSDVDARERIRKTMEFFANLPRGGRYRDKKKNASKFPEVNGYKLTMTDHTMSESSDEYRTGYTYEWTKIK